MIKEITLSGTKELQEGLNLLRTNLSRPSEPLDRTGDFMQREALNNFARRGRVFQEKGWTELTPLTKKIKAKEWPGRPMMVRTGLLRGSFGVMRRISLDKGQVQIYNPVSYASIHQFTGVGRKLTRRALLKLLKKQIDYIVDDIFMKWIEKLIGESFK